MLIVIEGLDGSGKSTQVRKVRTYLEERLGNVDYLHFPRYDAPVYGPLISSFLRGDFGAIDAVHPKLVALLYAEDRHGACRRMRDVLESGACMLLDRYVCSNIAYQCAKLGDSRERAELQRWIEDTEYGDFGLPRPDINIFLDVPFGFVRRKLSSERSGSDREYLSGSEDIHEADLAFQEKVREVYLRQCELDPGFIRVDCSDEGGAMLPPDEIFSRIRTVLDSRLGQSKTDR